MQEIYYSFRCEGEATLTLPQGLVAQFPQLFASLKQARKLIDQGLVRVNGVYQNRASAQIHPGDRVELLYLQERGTNCELLYEDSDLLVINKPFGVTTDQEELTHLLGQKVIPVHRLDKLTSGVLLLAKNPEMEKSLLHLFKERQIEKRYLAVVDGQVTAPRGKITAPLLMERKKVGGESQAVIVRVHPQGKPSETVFERLNTTKKASLLLLKPLTGRTHQLRVHLKHIGHPILGDTYYTRDFACSQMVGRLLLHAYSVKFIDPRRGEERIFTAPLESLFISSCKRLFGSGVLSAGWDGKLHGIGG